MHKCLVCNREFDCRISLEKHIGTSYGKEKKRRHMPLLVYEAKYENQTKLSKRSLNKMYKREKKSTVMISEELGVNKSTLLSAMHYYQIKLRNTSEAAKNQSQRDGVWNKGKTKKDHPSIMKYANSRRGKNNPYYTAPGFEERQKKSRERFLGIHRQQCHNCTPKSTEGRVTKILDAANLQYLQHFYIKHPRGTWRLYDFLVEGTLIIETHGDYYHANPKRYNPEDRIVIASKNRKAKDVWAHDADKEVLARQHGYNYQVFWEDELNDMEDDEILAFIRRRLT